MQRDAQMDPWRSIIDAEAVPSSQLARYVRERLHRTRGPVFVRHVSSGDAQGVSRIEPTGSYHHALRLLIFRSREPGDQDVHINVVTAGTADLPVGQETTVAAQALGLRVRLEADVGVAGLHRVLRLRDVLERAVCTVAVAGMEGALPSVVARLVSHPVIAVPTSVGYGASFDGLAALLAMRSSGIESLRTTGIDEGIEAAVLARRAVQRREG